jgi:hypothetical protein
MTRLLDLSTPRRLDPQRRRRDGLESLGGRRWWWLVPDFTGVADLAILAGLHRQARRGWRRRPQRRDV